MNTEKKFNILFIIALVVMIGLSYYSNYQLQEKENHYQWVNGQYYQLQKDYDLLVKEGQNKSNLEYEIQQYKLIIKNMHQNYNNQDERFDSMLNYSLNAREEVFQCNEYMFKLDYILRMKYNWSGEFY